MGATASLRQAVLAVEPGSEVATEIVVRNTGGVVDQFALDVIGDAAAWATVEPPSLSLFPNAEGTATVTFRPPRQPTTSPGAVTFGVRVRSTEDPVGSIVEEGTLQVGSFLAPSAELIPRTSHGGRSGRHELAIDNRGNVPLAATVAGLDPDRLIRFDVDPPTLDVPPGTAGFARVLARPARTFWRGAPRNHPFQLSLTPNVPDAVPLLIDGSYLQESILPPWFARAIGGLIALIVAAVLLWLLVLRPQIASTAAQTLVDFGFSPKPGSVAGGGGGGAASPTPATTPGPGATPAPSAIVITTTPPPSGAQAPVDGRLDTGTNAITPAGGTLYITDLVFSNPTGASGDLTLQRTAGGTTSQLLVLRLENFRDLDFHFVTPIAVHAGDTLTLVARCTPPTTPSTPSATCAPALFYSGYLKAS
jgi:hypothetical protein